MLWPVPSSHKLNQTERNRKSGGERAEKELQDTPFIEPYLCGESAEWTCCCHTPIHLALDYSTLWGAGGVWQQVELRMREHVTGRRSPVILHWNTDSQSLILTKIPKDPLRAQRADVTMVRWDGGYEVVQQQVTRDCDARYKHQQD